MDGNAWVRRCRPLLGTFVEISTTSEHARAIDEAFASITRVHAAMSFHDEDSDLARLRRAPPGTTIETDPWTVTVLEAAISLYRATDGLFDICVAWHLVVDGLLPRPECVDIKAQVGLVRDITLVDDRHVCCKRPLLIDLGGIAKGFAVDAAIETLMKRGVPEAIVNAGGDLRVFGARPHAVHLHGPEGALDGVVFLADAALASSSNRSLAESGLPSPHRGRGGDAVVCDEAVSVMAPTCLIADAMTKVAMIDPAMAARLLAEQDGAIVDRKRLKASTELDEVA